MYNQFRSKALFLSIVGVVSFAVSLSGWAQGLEPLGPLEAVYPEVVEPTGEPNWEGVEDSILLEEAPKTETREVLNFSDTEKEPAVVEAVETLEVEDVTEIVKQKGNRQEASVQRAGKDRLPLDALRTNRILRVAQLSSGENAGKKGTEQENGAEKMSASRQLLEQLSPIQGNYLDGVEAIDLRTFLNSPRLQYSAEAVKEALPTYWEASVLRSAVCYWERRMDALKKLAATATATDKTLYEAGVVAARSNLGVAKIALRMNAVKLGDLGGYTREVTTKTQPHAGNYETRYDDIRATQGEPSALATYLNGALKIHQEQVTATAAAYSTAEKLLKYQMSQGTDAVAVLAAWDMLNEQREAFFEALLEFNRDILNYVLQVSSRRGPELAPLLVRSVTEVTLEGSATRKAPSLPTTPREIIRRSENLPSVVENSETGALPQPALVDVPPTDTAPKYEENATVYVTPEGAAPILPPEAAVPAVVVPGGDLSAPVTETPAPESDFVPIGGETGVDVNPTLSPSVNTPGNGFSLENSGAIILPQNSTETKMKSQVTTVNYPNMEEKTRSVLTSSAHPERVQVTLEEVLSRTPPEKREQAVHTYWRYAIFQKQMGVLAYQQEILNAFSKRILAESLKSELSPLVGISLELQFLILRAELLKMRAEGWKEWCRLSGYLSETPTWQVNFPVAETEMKSEAFQVGLDRYAPGSEQDMKMLPLARHLYFCAGQLSIAFENVMALSELIVPPATENVEKSTFIQHLTARPNLERKTFWKMLACARSVSFRYFQLLYSMNSTYSSCILVGEHSADSATELAKILSQ